MLFFNKLKEPVFLKESSDAQRQLAALKELEPRLSPEGQKKIHQDIKYLEYGIFGENQIAYELKNSHMPMYILHDIYLEEGDLNAQIDYIVVTRKICFLIECKNLFGNIEINSRGEFIRTLEIGKWKTKEGIYSPITQNERHMELLKFIKSKDNTNMIHRYMSDRNFGNLYKSVVVLANPKTVLNDRYAKKEIKEKVIRGDQLIAYIKEQYRLSKEPENSDDKMKNWAVSLLEIHREAERDYTQKFERFLLPDSKKVRGEDKGKAADKGKAVDKGKTVDKGKAAADNAELANELKAYRLEKSREDKMKPYYIFNNNQLEDLIDKMPVSKQELQGVSGFGPVKAEKYGDDIINIIKKYSSRNSGIE